MWNITERNSFTIWVFFVVFNIIYHYVTIIKLLCRHTWRLVFVSWTCSTLPKHNISSHPANLLLSFSAPGSRFSLSVTSALTVHRPSEWWKTLEFCFRSGVGSRPQQDCCFIYSQLWFHKTGFLLRMTVCPVIAVSKPDFHRQQTSHGSLFFHLLIGKWCLVLEQLLLKYHLTFKLCSINK